MVLKSLKQILFLFLTLRGSSQKQAALQWEVWGGNSASLQHLRGASYCVQTTLLEASNTSVWGRAWSSWAVVPGRKQGWSSFTSSTLTSLCIWHSSPGSLVIHSNRGWEVAVGSHQDPQKLRMERLCCTLGSHCDGLGKQHTAALNGTGGTISGGNLTGGKWNCLWQEEAAQSTAEMNSFLCKARCEQWELFYTYGPSW